MFLDVHMNLHTQNLASSETDHDSWEHILPSIKARSYDLAAKALTPAAPRHENLKTIGILSYSWPVP